MAEAWGWLVSEGLIAEAATALAWGQFPVDGFYFVTRFGERVASHPSAREWVAAERRLDVTLHPRLEERARRQFVLGEFEAAAFVAMREVEMAVREQAELPTTVIGTDLMGADMALPKQDGGYERCWQSKHFPRKIAWEKCKDSLAAAEKHWSPRHYTFCFPRNLTVGLGHTRVDVADYKLVSATPASEAGQMAIRIEPQDAGGGEVFEYLTKDPTPVRRPPPPPRRKAQQAQERAWQAA